MKAYTDLDSALKSSKSVLVQNKVRTEYLVAQSRRKAVGLILGFDVAGHKMSDGVAVKALVAYIDECQQRQKLWREAKRAA